MITKNHTYLSRLDHLRFFAISLVVFMHFSNGIDKPDSVNSFVDFLYLWIKSGSTGVSLFLVISGFIFCVITDAGEKNIDYKKFITNRVFRILPLLLVIFFIIITINRENSTPLDILRVLTLQLNTGNPYTGWGNNIFPSGPIWTIAVEFQFYLIFPFIINIMHKQGTSKIFLFMLCMIIIRSLIVLSSSSNSYDNLYHSITGRLDQFLWGVLFGYYYIKQKGKGFKIPQSLSMIFLGLLIVSMLMIYRSHSNFYNIFSFNIEALGWSLFLMGYLTLNIKFFGLIDSSLAYLGGLSYSLYLTHLPVGLILSHKLSNHLHFNNSLFFTILIIFPVCIFISWITFNGIEKPFLMMRKKYL